MSEVLDKIKSRRSIRKYRSDMIPQDKAGEDHRKQELMRQQEWENSLRSSLL